MEPTCKPNARRQIIENSKKVKPQGKGNRGALPNISAQI